MIFPNCEMFECPNFGKVFMISLEDGTILLSLTEETGELK